MRKLAMLLSLIWATACVRAVYAQTSADGLDMEAIDKRAKTDADDLAGFVAGVLARQSEANVARADAQRVADAARESLAQKAASIRTAVTPGTRVDLDALVAEAGQAMAPPRTTAPMFAAFASLSMPQEALKQMIADVSKAGGMIVFRGFSADGGHAFMTALMRAIPESAAPRISIDPRLFRAYHIEAVPTYVAASSSLAPCAAPDCDAAPPPYDRLSGNVTTNFALETFADGDGPGAALAREALGRLHGAE